MATVSPLPTFTSSGVLGSRFAGAKFHFWVPWLLPVIQFFYHLPAEGADTAVAERVTEDRDAARVVVSADPTPAQPTLPLGTAIASLATEEKALEVVVQGKSIAQRMEESAEAVKVVDLKQEKLESADMGTVLARTPGVSVRRTGGLGSGTRFALNGMQDEQIRFFIDGVPLKYTAYASGISNVPVNLVSRIEIYSGVVPVRFGADALGGAVNLVTHEGLGRDSAFMAFQYGSFGTYRSTAVAQKTHKPTGLFIRLDAFYDAANNDYEVDVREPNQLGRLEDISVKRFHDAYEANAVGVQLGVINRTWARHLSFRGFFSGFDQELQSGLTMGRPFGEVGFKDSTAGGRLRYQVSVGEGWYLDMQGGYTLARGRFRDVAACVYDWYGECVRERSEPGELASNYESRNGSDRQQFQRTVYGLGHLNWYPRSWLSLLLSAAPSQNSRTGRDERITNPEQHDPLEAERELFHLVDGLESKIEIFDGTLQVIGFAKQYYQLLTTVEERPNGSVVDEAQREMNWGAGGAVRYQATDWLLAKSSYEWATRLPTAEEFFGDNASIIESPELHPERSHNANLGAAIDLSAARLGKYRGSVNAFFRDTDDLILLLPTDTERAMYSNIYSARSTGIEFAAGWTSAGEYLSVDGNFTSQRLVNTSSEGTFRDFQGTRLPHRPSYFANFSASMQLKNLLSSSDRLFLTAYTNWIDEFYRGWEGIGNEQYKQSVDAQLLHSLSLGYEHERAWGAWSGTLDVQNLTNEKAFDFYGSQKPGRALYGKLTAHTN